MFSIFDKLDDKAVTIIANDAQVINFIVNDCLKSIDIKTMSWLSPSAVTADSLEKLIENENSKTLTEDEELESKIVTLSFDFLSKLYKNIQVISPKQIQMVSIIMIIVKTKCIFPNLIRQN